MASEEFLLQLIQRSLNDLGYSQISEELDAEIRSRRQVKNKETIGEDENKQIKIIEWFNSEVKAGNYVTIESYLLEVLQNLESTKGTNFLELLTPSLDPKLQVSLVLYLVRRMGWFEMLVNAVNGLDENEQSSLNDRNSHKESQQLLITYLRDKLIPLLDEIGPSLENSPESEQFSFTSSDGDYLSNLDMKSIFGKTTVQSLTRELESSLLLGLATDFPFKTKTSSQKFLHILSSKYLLGHHLPGNDMPEILTSLRVLLLDTFLAKTFRLNEKLRTFDQNYDLPKDSLQRIVKQAITYQKQQNPYYLPPRTIEEQKEIQTDYENSIIIGVPQRETNEYFKKTDFPTKLLHTLNPHNDEVWFTRFSPLGKFMVTGSLDGKLVIYDVLNNFKVLKVLESSNSLDNQAFVPFSNKPPNGKAKAVIYCCWDPQEHYLVSCCLDTVVRVWLVAELHTLNKSKMRITRSMDEASSAGNEFKLLSCFTLGQEVKTWTCEFLPDTGELNYKPHFVIGSPDKVLKAFDVDGVELFDFFGNIENKSDVYSNEKSNDVQMKDASEHEIHDEDSDSNSNSKNRPKPTLAVDKKLENNFNRVNDLAITPDGKILITANNDRQIQFYRIPDFSDLESTTKRLAYINLRGRLTSCSIAASGKYLLLSCAPEELQIWDISGLGKTDTEGNEIYERPMLYRRCIGHSQSSFIVRSSFGYLVEDSNEEELVVTGSVDGCIYFWKLHTGQLITRIKGHDGLCNSVDWNRRGIRNEINDYGKLWCSVGDDKLVKIWGPSNWNH